MYNQVFEALLSKALITWIFLCVCPNFTAKDIIISPLNKSIISWGPHCILTFYCVNTFVSPHRGGSKAVLPPHASFPQHQPHSRVLGSLIMWFAVLTLSILRVKQELLTRTLKKYILTNFIAGNIQLLNQKGLNCVPIIPWVYFNDTNHTL